MLLTLMLLAAPDVEVLKSVRVMGRMGLAHACPISPTEAITAWHVTKRTEELSERATALWGYPSGQGGTLVASYSDARRDIAAVEAVDSPFPNYLQRAKTVPRPGEHLWDIGYDFMKRGLPSKVMKVKVTGYLPGRVVADNSPGQGSSGGCVVNAAGELVAVGEGMWTPEKAPQQHIFALVAGDWWPVPERWKVPYRRHEPSIPQLIYAPWKE